LLAGRARILDLLFPIDDLRFAPSNRRRVFEIDDLRLRVEILRCAQNDSGVAVSLLLAAFFVFWLNLLLKSRRQKTEDRRQKTEDRGQRAEGISNIEQGMSNDEVEIATAITGLAMTNDFSPPPNKFEGATRLIS